MKKILSLFLTLLFSTNIFAADYSHSNSMNAKLFEEILELRQNYDDIIQILSDKDTNLYFDVSSNLFISFSSVT